MTALVESERVMNSLPIPLDKSDAAPTNSFLSNPSAHEIVEWSVDTFGDGLVMSTSFGIQSAVIRKCFNT